MLCMEFDGSTCPDALENVLTVDPYTGRTFADLMLVDRIVLQDKQYPDAADNPPPAGWTWVSAPEPAASQVHVLERVDGPVSTQAGRVTATVGTEVAPESAEVNSERLRVTAPDGGSVVFARLAWPGYTATLDGAPLQTKGLGDMFLMVDLPPGTVDAELEISFRPPGQRLGFAAAGFGLVLIVVLTGLYYRDRRPSRTDAPVDAGSSET
jgi:hypothetical protein